MEFEDIRTAPNGYYINDNNVIFFYKHSDDEIHMLFDDGKLTEFKTTTVSGMPMSMPVKRVSKDIVVKKFNSIDFNKLNAEQLFYMSMFKTRTANS